MIYRNCSKESSILLTPVLVLLAAILQTLFSRQNMWMSSRLIRSKGSLITLCIFPPMWGLSKNSAYLMRLNIVGRQQWRHLGDHISPPSPCLLISLVNLIAVLSRQLPSLKEQCGPSLHSSPLLPQIPSSKKIFWEFVPVGQGGGGGLCTVWLSSTVDD